MTTQSQSLRLADQLAAQPYCWPGGYPLFAITSDGLALCRHCVKTEREAIGTTTGTDGWCVVAIDANYENPSLYCDHCDRRIESAYAEPPEPNIVLNDSHGVYIPQLWCADITEADAERLGISWEDVKTCQAGPYQEWYWEAWQEILNDCVMADDNGVTWRLYQDGDLWEVADGYEFPEG